MQLDLTPEIEQVLQAEASASGLSPEAITLRILSSYTQIRSQRRGGPSLHELAHAEDSTASGQNIIPAEISEERQAAAVRILGRRKNSTAKMGPPAGMDWREWIHEGHQY